MGIGGSSESSGESSGASSGASIVLGVSKPVIDSIYCSIVGFKLFS